MPGKSRRSRAKHSAQQKKKEGKVVGAIPQPVPTDKPVAAIAASSPSAARTVANITHSDYQHIISELRRIGILAGIMLAILVVLALVLS